MHCLKLSHMKYLLALLCIAGVVSMVLTKMKHMPYEPGNIENIIECKSNLMVSMWSGSADDHISLGAYFILSLYGGMSYWIWL